MAMRACVNVCMHVYKCGSCPPPALQHALVAQQRRLSSELVRSHNSSMGIHTVPAQAVKQQHVLRLALTVERTCRAGDL